MAVRDLGLRGILTIAITGITLPLIMGQGCESVPGGQEALDAVATPKDAGVDVGASIFLQGSATGGVGPYTFSWSPADGLDNSAASETAFTPTTTGTNIFTLTVTDSIGVQARDAVTITVYPQLIADAGLDKTATVGETMTLAGGAQGGDGNYSYLWTSSPAVSLTGAETVAPTFTPADEGTIIFTLRVTDGTGAGVEDTLTVAVAKKTTLSTLTWEADYLGDGYEVLVGFSQGLNQSSAQDVTEYRVNATGANPVSAVLGPDKKTVSLIFVTPLAASDRLDLGIGDGLIDVHGNKIEAVTATAVSPNLADTTGPVVNERTWAANSSAGYQIEIVFNESLDRSSAETASAYRISDTQTAADSASLSNDGKTVTVVFNSTTLTTLSKIDINVGNVIRDINGNPAGLDLSQQVFANSQDTTPPKIEAVKTTGTTETWFNITVEFSEVMRKTTVEDITAYQALGSSQANPTSATLSPDGRTVALVFQGALAAYDKLIISVNNKLTDINGQILNQEIRAIESVTGDTTNPDFATLTWLDGASSTGYQLTALFNEEMDRVSVERVNNWKISGTQIIPASVVLATDNKTAAVTFGDPVNRDALVSISVGNTIKDGSGNVIQERALPINVNIADTIGPTVSALVWGSNLQQFRVLVTFSETMDAASAGEPQNYAVIRTDQEGAQVILGYPTKIEIDGMGRIVTLEFLTLTEGLRSRDDPDLYPPPDRLQITKNVRDINGRSTTSIYLMNIDPNPDDAGADPANAPTASKTVWGIDKGPYEVVITFSEAMDASTATNPVYYTMGVADTKPSSATLFADGRTLTLTFNNETFGSMITGDDELDISNKVLDINGNECGSRTVSVANNEKDKLGPVLMSATYELDNLARYKITATFNEALDASSVVKSAFKWGNRVAISADLEPGGTTVTLFFIYPTVTGLFYTTDLTDINGNKQLDNM